VSIDSTSKVSVFENLTYIIFCDLVEGICDNQLPKGTHKIGIYLGRCRGYYSQPTKTVTGGFNSPSRLHIEEVRREHAVDGGDVTISI